MSDLDETALRVGYHELLVNVSDFGVSEDAAATIVAKVARWLADDANLVVPAVMAERERCAKIAESKRVPGSRTPFGQLQNTVCGEIADEIREGRR